MLLCPLSVQQHCHSTDSLQLKGTKNTLTTTMLSFLATISWNRSSDFVKYSHVIIEFQSIWLAHYVLVIIDNSCFHNKDGVS